MKRQDGMENGVGDERKLDKDWKKLTRLLLFKDEEDERGDEED